MGFILLGALVALATFIAVRALHGSTSHLKYTLGENLLVLGFSLINGGIWAGAFWYFATAGL